MYKNNRNTEAIGVILAFTGKKMFYFNQKSDVPLKNSKTSCSPCSQKSDVPLKNSKTSCSPC
jgi:hypothetical protein